jgi:hypothetical protein
MRVAVLGALSSRGRRVVRDLLEQPEVSQVVLIGAAGRDVARLAASFDSRRVAPAPVLPTVEGISDALHGLDVALACLDAAAEGAAEAELAALEAAVVSGVPYVSSCEDPETIAAMFTAKSGDATLAIPGMSWTPGISNLLVRAGAEQLDGVRAVRVAWCTSRREDGADALGRLLVAWSGDAEVIEGGGLRRRRAGSRSESVFFPEPVGWQRVHLARGAEVLSLPALLGELDSLVVQAGLAGGSTASLARAVASTSRGPQPRAGGAPGPSVRRRLAVLTRSAAAALAPLGPRGTGWSALRVDVTGRAGGSSRVMTFGLVDHLANLETAPLVVAGLMVGSGEAAGKGIVAPEVALEPGRFFSLLRERGVRAARLER